MSNQQFWQQDKKKGLTTGFTNTACLLNPGESNPVKSFAHHNILKTLKTSLLSTKDHGLPDSPSSNKHKPTSNMRQQEEMQQNRISGLSMLSCLSYH
jgi:hypothetical protein